MQVLRTLSVSASDAAIRGLVVEWVGLLAAHRYEDALRVIQYSSERDWDAETLASMISGYGLPGIDADTLSLMLEEHGVERFELASLQSIPAGPEVIEGIEVDRLSLYGLDPALYLGMVHYWDVLLKGTRSDLTARFAIKRVGTDAMTLEFLDIHVM